MGAFRIFRRLSELLDVAVVSPTDGEVLTYSSADSKWENAAATGGGGGAPTDATYITQTPDATLSAEQALSGLATGIVKNTTATGVLSIAAEGSDYTAPGGTDVAVADGGTGASSASDARTNLGLGTAAVAAAGDFDAAGAAAAAQAASQPLDSDLTAIAALTTTSFGRALLALADAAALRTAGGLGTAATSASTDFQAADADLTALAGLTSAADKLPYFTGSAAAAVTTLTSFIRTLLDDADAATARATLGVIASLFQSGGAQALALDTLAAATDITTLNASTSAHGLLPKLDNTATHYLDGTGSWSTPGSSGSEIGYDQITSPVTVSSSTEASATTVISAAAHTFDGAAVIAHFFCPVLTTGAGSGNPVTLCLFESTTEIARFGQITTPSAGALQTPFNGFIRFTPTAGSHTYIVSAFRAGNNGTVTAGASGTAAFPPAFIRFVKA